jgi:hypothetical protein
MGVASQIFHDFFPLLTFVVGVITGAVIVARRRRSTSWEVDVRVRCASCGLLHRHVVGPGSMSKVDCPCGNVITLSMRDYLGADDAEDAG